VQQLLQEINEQQQQDGGASPQPQVRRVDQHQQ
jgi:hypothetical protein